LRWPLLQQPATISKLNREPRLWGALRLRMVVVVPGEHQRQSAASSGNGHNRPYKVRKHLLEIYSTPTLTTRVYSTSTLSTRVYSTSTLSTRDLLSVYVVYSRSTLRLHCLLDIYSTSTLSTRDLLYVYAVYSSLLCVYAICSRSTLRLRSLLESTLRQ
jgi:hypothetical protein